MLLMSRKRPQGDLTDQTAQTALCLHLLAALIFLASSARGIFVYSGPDIFDAVSRIAFSLCFPFRVFGGLAVLILWAGRLQGKKHPEQFAAHRLVNHAGETPLLVAVRQDETDDTHGKITCSRISRLGVPKPYGTGKARISKTALNNHIADIQECDGKRRIRLFTVPAKSSLPKLLRWKDEYLQNDFGPAGW